VFTHAITRRPGPDFADGLTTATLGTPDHALIGDQHRTYVKTLQTLGLEVVELAALPGYPDAYFVEDVALITPHVAIITNPGAAPRKGEQTTIEPVIEQFRDVVRITEPGTVDGGDVLMVGSHFFIGVSERTNQSGCEQLGQILKRYGNSWTAVPVESGLHLKSAVNHVGGTTLLVTEQFADHGAFRRYEKILLDVDEEYAGNTLLINDHLLTPSGFPRTKAKLERLGLPIIELEMSEARKMDGGLTCFSLRF